MLLRFFILLSSTPLLYASALGDCFFQTSTQEVQLKTIKEIYNKEKKINGDKEDFLGTPLYMAAKSGSIELVTFLIEKGANVNQASPYLDRPLHVASAYGHLEVVKYLIKHKAKRNKKNSIGKTALELAKLQKKHAIVKYLKSLKTNQKVKAVSNKEINNKEISTAQTETKKTENFKHLPYVKSLGVVDTSKPYVKETKSLSYNAHAKKSDNIKYQPEQETEKFDKLPFVQTLEVVSQSTPYIK